MSTVEADREPVSAKAPTTVSQTPLPRWLAGVLVLLSSGSVLVLEIAALRLVAPYIGLTMEANTLIIGIALSAIAVGTRLGGLLADRTPPRLLVGPSFLVGGLCILLIAPLLRMSAQWFEDGAGHVVLLYLVVGGLLFLPAAVLSIVTPAIIKAQLGDLTRTGDVVGRLSSLSTWGAIIATFLTGFGFLLLFSVDVLLMGVGAVLIALGLVLCLTWLRVRGTSVAGVLLLVPTVVATSHALAPNTCEYETAYHCAEIRDVQGDDRRKLLMLDNLRHSVVDLDDPTYLEFAYVRTLASVVDAVLPTEKKSNTAFIGAGALTLPRYLAATHPGAQSSVFEIDRGVADLAQTQFGPVDSSITVHVTDARLGVRDGGMYDLVIGDAFSSMSVPWHLATREFFTEIREHLTSDGVYAMNVIDGGDRRLLAAEVATLASVFQHVAVFAGDAKRSNFVIVASDAELPLTQIDARNQQRSTQNASLTLLSEGRTQQLIDDGTVFTDTFAPADQYLG